MSALEFPTNIYVFGGFRRYGAEIVLVEAEDGIRTDLQRLLDAIDEQNAAGAAVAGALPQQLHPGCARGDRQGPPGGRARDPRHLSGGRRHSHRPDGARRGLRRWRIGQVAVRRTRRGLPLRAPGSRAHSRTRLHRLGRARRPLCIRGRGHSICRSARALPERHAQRAGALCRARRLRDRRRHRRRRDPREVARPDAAPDRARLRRRLPRQHADRRRRAGRRGDRRRARRIRRDSRSSSAARSSSITGRAPASACRRTSTIRQRRSSTRWTC